MICTKKEKSRLGVSKDGRRIVQVNVALEATPNGLFVNVLMFLLSVNRE